MTPIKLSLAIWDYDRVKALEDGRVKVEGVDLTFLNLRVEETFFRQLRYHEFDISEMSLSSYVMSLQLEDPPFIALPVFPTRIFRHQSIYVSKRAKIKSPSDLVGKRAACPEWQMTAPVWERGIMEDEYGIKPSDMTWFTGAAEPSKEERPEKLEIDLPFKVTRIKRGQNLAQMLADGEIDVLFTAYQPSTFRTSDNVVQLFPKYKEVEKAYYQKTKIFPIMHTIVIKRSVHDRHPWLARSATKAFNEALEYAYAALSEKGSPRYILPWLKENVEEIESAFGTDRWWQDGLKENYHVLDKFLEYHHRQHLSKRRLKPEELFASSATESFII